MTSEVTVDCYAGYKAHERPYAFSLGRKKIRVAEIRDQWYGPDHTYFKVLAEDANIYILRHSETDDLWDVVFFNEGNYQGETSPGMEKGTSA